MADRRTEVLRELWKVTEYKDGAVYKTKYIRDVWIPTDYPDAPKDHMFVVKSSNFEGDTLRSRKVDF